MYSSWEGGSICLESSAVVLSHVSIIYVNLFFGNGNIFLLGAWEHRFIGGLDQNLLGGCIAPFPPDFHPCALQLFVAKIEILFSSLKHTRVIQ